MTEGEPGKPHPDHNPQRHSSSLLWVLMTVLIGLSAVYAVRLTLGRSSTAPHPAVGTSLTALSIEPLTSGSKPLTLPDLKGKVALINFWGPWCHYCRLEFPHFKSIHERFANHDQFAMVLVSCSAQVGGDLNQLRSRSKEFLRDQGLDVPVYSDPLARTRLMLESHGLKPFGYPTTMILDEEGVIRGLWLGYGKNNATEMNDLLSELLGKAQ